MKMSSKEKIQELLDCIYTNNGGISSRITALMSDAEVTSFISQEEINVCKQFECGLICARTHSPLHMAVRANSRSFVKALIEAGANVNCVDMRACETCKLTPLHCAVVDDKPDMVELLLTFGANVDLKTTSLLHNFKDKTALEVAKMKFLHGCVKVFEDRLHLGESKMSAEVKKGLYNVEKLKATRFRKQNELNLHANELLQQENYEKRKLVEQLKKEITSLEKKHQQWLELQDELKLRQENMSSKEHLLRVLNERVEELQTKRDKDHTVLLGEKAALTSCQKKIMQLEVEGCSQKDIYQLKNLLQSLQNSIPPIGSHVGKDTLECAICITIPKNLEVYSCAECSHFVCQSCKDNMALTCPFCRTNLETVPLMRNKVIERFIKNLE